jgi:DNA-binding NarL/FixJ family response regulator
LVVVGEAGDGRQAVKQALQLHPEVVLMDVAMPLLNGIEATRQILQQSPETKVLILSSYTDRHRVEAALEAGAAGYFRKETIGDNLIAAIREALAGKPCFSPELQPLAEQWKNRSANNSGSRTQPETLTCREAEVLQLIAEGFSGRDIAKGLGLCEKTVQKHRQSLMDKLDLHGIAGLTRYAIAKGFIEVDGKPFLRSTHLEKSAGVALDPLGASGPNPISMPGVNQSSLNGAGPCRDGFSASGVKVSVIGSKVLLTGLVESWEEYEEFQRFAWAAPGVTDVENVLSVNQPQPEAARPAVETPACHQKS